MRRFPLKVVDYVKGSFPEVAARNLPVRFPPQSPTLGWAEEGVTHECTRRQMIPAQRY